MDISNEVRNTHIFLWQPFLRQMLVCTVPWSLYFITGVCLGAPTVIFAQLKRETNSSSNINDEIASWTASALGYSGSVWVFGLITIAHYFGRKKTLILLSLNACAASAVMYCSKNVMYVLISQILHGMTSGSVTSITVIILTEYTSPKYRGIFLTIKSATTFWGIWVSNVIGTYFHYTYIGVLGMICAVYNMIVLFYVPESPYWLASKDKYDECAASYRWLRGVDESTEQELDVLINCERDLKRTKCKSSLRVTVRRYVNSCLSPEVYKPIGFCLLLFIMYYASGKLVLAVYSLEMFTKITGSQSSAYTGMLVLDGFTVLGMYVGCGLSKILKRRVLLLSASTVGTMFLYAMACYLYLVKFAIIIENNYICLFLLTGFSLGVSSGPLLMSTTIIGEIIPLKLRSSCLCFISVIGKLLLGTSLKISPLIFRALGFHGTFLVFATSSTVCIFLMYKYLPETKDLTLHQIADLFKIRPLAEQTELVFLQKKTNQTKTIQCLVETI